VQIARKGNDGMRARDKDFVVSSGVHRELGVVAFDGDVVLQGLVDVITGYVIKHKEILDKAASYVTIRLLGSVADGSMSFFMQYYCAQMENDK